MVSCSWHVPHFTAQHVSLLVTDYAKNAAVKERVQNSLTSFHGSYAIDCLLVRTWWQCKRRTRFCESTQYQLRETGDVYRFFVRRLIGRRVNSCGSSRLKLMNDPVLNRHRQDASILFHSVRTSELHSVSQRTNDVHSLRMYVVHGSGTCQKMIIFPD